jgi:integrase
VVPLPAPAGQFKAQARWTEDGRRRAQTFTALSAEDAHDAAVDHLIAIRRARRDGRYIPPSLMTVGDLVDVYIARTRSGWQPSTEHTYRRMADNYIVAHLGSVRLVSLTKAQVQHWIDQLAAAGLAPKTIHNAVAFFRTILAHAVDMELIPRSPAVGTRAPRQARQPRTVWSLEEIARVLAAVADNPFMAAFYRLAMGAGLRPGELQALQWSDLDLERRTLTIQRTATRDARGKGIVGTRTKSGKPRVIELPDGVLDALRAWRVQQRSRVRNTPVRPFQPFIFSTRADGGMQHRSSLATRHERVIARAGVAPIPLHRLRHIFATVSMEHGVNPLSVSRILGHSSVKITLDMYSHPSDQYQRTVMESIDAVISGSLGNASHTTTNEGPKPPRSAPKSAS